MEINDLKENWDAAPAKEMQEGVVNFIDQVTQNKYQSKIKKIVVPELTGIAICLSGALFIVFKWYKLDTYFLQGTGIFAIMLLITLSIISYISIRNLNIRTDFNKPHAEMLKIFSEHTLQFYKLQKWNMTLSYLLLVTVLVLLTKLFNNLDLTTSKYFWIFSFSAGYLFLSAYARWVSKYYSKTLKESETLLGE